jgi:polyisoprenyl-phosphate glycosyltransferase
MMTPGTDRSVVIPVYNEEENLRELHTRLSDTLKKMGGSYELIFVDDGSTDGSFKVLEGLRRDDDRVRAIRFSRNFGQEAAFEAGFRHTQGQYVIQLDADLQNPPEEIPKLIEMMNDQVDIVYGIRKDRKDSFLRKALSRLFHEVMIKLFRIRLPREVSTFRIIRGKTAREVASLPERGKFFAALASWCGARHAYVELEHRPRKRGASKWNLPKLVLHSMDLVLGHTVIPLRFISFLGVLFSLAGLVIGLWMLFKKIIFGISVSGFTSLFTAITILSGVQLFSLGVIGEYLSRIYTETQRRPESIIAQTLGF